MWISGAVLDIKFAVEFEFFRDFAVAGHFDASCEH
jgi:hypothetical protein